MPRFRFPIAGLLLAALLTAATSGCNSGGGAGGPTEPPVPQPPQTVNNQLAVIIDMRSSGQTKPVFEVRLDGTLFGRQDYTQSSTHCQGAFFGKCSVGGAVPNITGGRHTVRVTLVSQVGSISRWELIGVAQVTNRIPFLTITNIDLPSKTRTLRPGDSVEWSFQVNL